MRKSTDSRYSPVIITLHWLTALVLFVILNTGFRAADSAEGVAKAALLRLHIPLAWLVLALTLARILWWWLLDSRPAAPAGTPPWQAALARAVHLGLYAGLLAMIGSGFTLVITTGAAEAIFGSAPMPDLLAAPARAVHGILANLLIALLALHIAAALFHAGIRRDGTLRRMWFGR